MAESGSTIRGGGAVKNEQSLDGKLAELERSEPTPEEALESVASAQERARIAQILEMGLVTDMITITDGDPDKRYVLVRERDMDMQKFALLGYELETQVESVGTHGAADDRRRVGDTVLMSVPRARYELIQSVDRERKMKRMRSPVQDYKRKAAQAAQTGSAAPPLDLLEGA